MQDLFFLQFPHPCLRIIQCELQLLDLEIFTSWFVFHLFELFSILIEGIFDILLILLIFILHVEIGLELLD